MADGHLPGRTGFFCPAFRYAGDPASLMTEVPIMIPKDAAELLFQVISECYEPLAFFLFGTIICNTGVVMMNQGGLR
jgi:hypothetical protein